MVRTISRLPKRTESCPMSRIEPVNITIPKSAAFTQCAVRSTRSKRVIGASGGRFASGGVVVAAIRPSDPSVDVVAVVLPVTRFDPFGDLDRVQPLGGLVAVHRC